jgi:hypothetical protein
MRRLFLGMLEFMATKKRADEGVNGDTQRSTHDSPNPVWFKPIMFGFMLLGLVWIITYYVSSSLLPIASLGSINLVIGFGLMFVGFIMTTRWR